MTRRSIAIATAGAVAGAVISLMLLVLASLFVAETAPGAIVLSESQSIARAQFVANAGAVYLLVVVGFAAAGALLAVLTATLAGRVFPDVPRFRPAGVTVAGALISMVVAYSTLRAGFGAVAVIYTDPVAGGTTITISVFRALMIALIVGAVAGSTTAISAEYLSRPVAVGLTGPAWPKTAARFVSESMPAMAIPILAIVIGFVIVIVISQILLTGEESMKNFSVVAGIGISALVLAVAAFVASHPRRDNGNE